MLKEIKLPFNVSFMEALSLTFFATLGYLFLYRYSYYNELGISWYLTSINPSQVLSGSLRICIDLFLGLVIFVLILYLASIFEKYKERILLGFLFFLICLWLIFIFSKDGKIFEIKSKFFELTELSFVAVLHYSIIPLVGRIILKKNNRIITENKDIERYLVQNKISEDQTLLIKEINIIGKQVIVINYFVLLMLFLFTPTVMGQKDALHILKYRTSVLSEAKVNGDKNKWYILDVTGDKVLLVKEYNKNEGNNEFKFIEYKEVKSIFARTSKEIDPTLVNFIGLSEKK